MANSTSLLTSIPPPLLLLWWRHLETGGQSSSPISCSSSFFFFFLTPLASHGVTSNLLLLLLLLLFRWTPLSSSFFKFSLPLLLAALDRGDTAGTREDTRDQGNGVNRHIQPSDLGHRGPLWGLPAGPLLLILLLLVQVLLLPVPGSGRDGLFVAPAPSAVAHFT